MFSDESSFVGVERKADTPDMALILLLLPYREESKSTVLLMVVGID